jgi:hypothetical protein
LTVGRIEPGDPLRMARGNHLETIGSKSGPHFVSSSWVSPSSGSLLKRYRYPHSTCAS